MATKAEEIVGILSRCPMFSSLREEELRELAAAALLQEHPHGAVLFSEGDRCEGFYIVDRGTVKISKMSPAGREQVLHVVRAGDSFAEVALFAGGDYPATAFVLDDARLVFMRRIPFLKTLQARPELLLRLLASISQWARRLATMVENLTLRDARARLAAYLLSLAGDEAAAGATVRLPTKKKLLAAQLSITSETLSRTFSVLRDSGLIEDAQGRVRLLDPRALRVLLEGE
ncbi:MAG: Crp/Fnr family transcriptional regulator [Candidatus Tectomicrobia bacterium]|nr:Crp/Fnr family transcriptional regulator [Candidatus Tectomicrobia bacterium]